MKYISPLCVVICLVAAGPAWALDAPGNFRCADCSSTTLTWAWDDVAGEDRYAVFDNATDTVMISNIPADETTTTETGLTPNTTYVRYCRAYTIASSGVTNCPSLYSCRIYGQPLDAKVAGFWRAGLFNNDDRMGGIVKFDVSSFAPGTVVNDVWLYAYCFNGNPNVDDLDIRKISIDPIPASAAELINDLLGSTVFLFNGSTMGLTSGDKWQNLWSSADTWVEDAINGGTDCCSLGVVDETTTATSNYCEFREWNYGTVGRRPVLEVTWEVRSYGNQSNVIEACTLATVPLLQNRASTFIFANSDTITVLVDPDGNPADTTIELFSAKGDTGGPTEVFTSAGTQTSGYSWDITGLDYDTSYWFTARAQNWVGIWSDCCSITTWSTHPGVPVNFRNTDCTSNTLQWSWDSFSGNGFIIYDADTDAPVITDIPFDATYTVESGLLPNTTYRRYIRTWWYAYPLKYYYADNQTATAGSIGWELACWLNISPPPEPGNYLIIGTAQVEGIDFEAAMTRTDSTVPHYARVDTKVAGTYHSYMSMEVLGADGVSTYDYALWVKGTSATMTNAAIIAIKLPTENHNFVRGEPLGLATSSGGYTTHATLIVTPPGLSDYLAVFAAEVWTDSTNSEVRSQFISPTPPSVVHYSNREPDNNNERMVHAGFWPLTNIATNQDLSLRVAENGFSTAYIYNSNIVAFSLSDSVWDGWSYNAAVAQDSHDTTTAKELVSTAFTPQKAQNYLLFASCQLGISATSRRTIAWWELETGGVPTQYDEMEYRPDDQTLNRATFAGMRRIFLPAVPHTLRLQYRLNNGGATAYAAQGCVVALPLDGAGKEYTYASNTAEACTLADVPTMDNTAVTFTAQNDSSITAQVGLAANPVDTTIELLYALGDANGPTVAFSSAGAKTSGYSWDVSGLGSDTSYWFLARAQNWAGIWSDCCSVTVWSTEPGAALPAPTSFSSYDCTSSSITWTWTDNSVSENGFELLEAGGDVVITLAQDATYTVETGLSENTQYTRLARAFQNPGPIYSSNSNIVSAYTLCNPPTDPEVSISDVTDSAMKVRVTTCPNPSADSTAAQFHEAAAAAPDSTWVTDIETGDFVFTAGGLSPNTSYAWQAQYRNGDGVATGYNTTPFMRFTHLADPILADFSVTSDDASRVVMSYATPPNGSVDQTGSFFEFVAGGSGGDNSGWQNSTYNYIDDGLATNTTYSYRVQLRNAEGVATSFTGAKSCVTLGAVPGAPQFSSITSSSVTVSWSGNGNPGWTVYELARSDGAPWASIANTTNLSYDDFSLAAGTIYNYRVRSLNLEVMPSGWSVENSFQTLPPQAPIVTILSAPVLIYGNTAAPPLSFVCDQDTDFQVQRGGDGSLGSGVSIAAGAVTAGVSQNVVLLRADLDPDNVALDIFVTCYESGNAANFGFASCTVYDDHIGPTAVVSFPADGQFLAQVDAISGTVSDSGGGNVGLTELVLYSVTDDLYYDNATVDFTSVSPVYFAVPGTDNWSFNSSGVTNNDGSTYTTYVRSIDTVGNFGPVSGNVSFTIDVALPTITIESPGPGPATVIGPSVDAVVQWRVDMDCDYFLRVGGNGSIASGVDVGSGFIVADNSIVSTVPAALFLDDTTERLYVIVRSAALSVAYNFRDFHDDETPPVTSVRTTLGGTLSSLELIAGISEDSPAGLQSVELAIRDANDLFYVPVSGKFEPGQTYFLANGLSSWQYDTSGVPFARGMSYTVSTRVTDNVGNVDERDVGTFVVYTKPAFSFIPKKKKGGCGLSIAENSEPPDKFGYFLPFVLMMFILILFRSRREVLVREC